MAIQIVLRPFKTISGREKEKDKTPIIRLKMESESNLVHDPKFNLILELLKFHTQSGTWVGRP